MATGNTQVALPNTQDLEHPLTLRILANTYACPSHGHIKQLKDNSKNITKGSQCITDYIQDIKTKDDDLAALGKPLDHEDLIEKVLKGLDDTYQSVIDAVNSRDAPIT
ncbi:hypothetical protein J1N35_029421 [Gossypium stocksii]|uniref:Uncharacterized protein n=1 Tax=Gossypium stocksii TaxID=47602 RepID=A0A9D3ZTR9_9ROSI|nr:hypothetical protein J1N35_029421 [Gossypium stocksii]